MLMVNIDCAYDDKLADQLTKYLCGLNYNAKEEQSIVIVDDNVPEKTLREFLTYIKKPEYSITHFTSDTMILSKKLSIKDMQCAVFGDILERQGIIR